MEQMIEQPQPPEGDEATTGTMSPLATVRQYLSTNTTGRPFSSSRKLSNMKITKSPTLSEGP